MEHSLCLLRPPAWVSVQAQVCNGGPHRDNAPRVEREQGAKVAAPRIVQVEAGADLQCRASAYQSIYKNTDAQMRPAMYA